MARLLAARGESPAAFDRHCIPPGYVASRSHTAGMLPRRTLPRPGAALLTTGLGATRNFHHGLLGMLAACALIAPVAAGQGVTRSQETSDGRAAQASGIGAVFRFANITVTTGSAWGSPRRSWPTSIRGPGCRSSTRSRSRPRTAGPRMRRNWRWPPARRSLGGDRRLSACRRSTTHHRSVARDRERVCPQLRQGGWTVRPAVRPAGSDRDRSRRRTPGVSRHCGPSGRHGRRHASRDDRPAAGPGCDHDTGCGWRHRDPCAGGRGIGGGGTRQGTAAGCH